MRRLIHAGPIAAALLLPLSACAPTGPIVSASLPADAVPGFADPTRYAILHAASAFAHPARLAGQPAAAAIAVAQLEYLAVEVPGYGMWRDFSPLTGDALRAGRDEARAALGISPAAPPQQVIDGLFATARALGANDRAAAERLLATGGAADPASTLDRLAALPPLPQANVATVRAANELMFRDRGDRLWFTWRGVSGVRG